MNVHPDTTSRSGMGPCLGCGMIRVVFDVPGVPMQQAIRGGVATEFWFERSMLKEIAAQLVKDAAISQGLSFCRTCAPQSNKADGAAA